MFFVVNSFFWKHMFVFGGQNEKGKPLDDFHCFNFSTVLYVSMLFITNYKTEQKSWKILSPKGKLPSARYRYFIFLWISFTYLFGLCSHTATVIAQKMTVIGGRPGKEKHIYNYDFSLNEWTILGMCLSISSSNKLN